MFKVEEIARGGGGGAGEGQCRGLGQNMCFVVTVLGGEVPAPALIPASLMAGAGQHLGIRSCPARAAWVPP